MKTKSWLLCGGTAIVAGGIGWYVGRYMFQPVTNAAGDILTSLDRAKANVALGQMGLTCGQWKQLDKGWQVDAVHRRMIGAPALPFSAMRGKSPIRWTEDQRQLNSIASPAALLRKEAQMHKLLYIACIDPAYLPETSPPIYSA